MSSADHRGGDAAESATASSDPASGDGSPEPLEPPAEAAEGAEAVLKIDDLARLTGITVDTIRFYQREGLLPGTSRQGRSITYGSAHVRALERIKDLQAKHFSLRAIKLLADEGKLGLVEVLFTPDTERETPQERGPEEVGDLDPGLISDLASVGLVLTSESRGRRSPEEQAAARAVQSLVALGMPRNLVLLLVELYVKKLSELEAEIIEAVAGKFRSIPTRPLIELASDPANLASIVPLVEVVFHYVQTQSMKRMVQDAVESLAEEGS